jgi:hypothetical protein
MKKLLFALLMLALGASSLALAQPYENPTVVGQVPDRVVITVKEGVKMNLDKSADGVSVGVASLDQLVARFDVHDMDQMHKGLTSNMKDKNWANYFDRVWYVDFDPQHDLNDVKKTYEALPEVELVRLVDICRMDSFLPNDISQNQWYLRNMTPGGKDVRGVGGWAETLGDTNIVVAVLDSGMDWQHPDLGGTHPDKVNGALWTNWAEYYGNPNSDDDGNGKVDDIRGWDFVNVPASQGWPDEDVTSQDNDPMDYGGHGTNCAGCIAPITNNGIGIAATAPGCKIMAVRVGYLPNGEDLGIVRMDFCSNGILYAVNNGANIINCSWGNTSYLSFAVSYALDNDVLMFSSAGNDDDTVADYLGTVNGVMSVAATTQSDSKADFSSYGSWVEISAPGVAMYTTHYDYVSGTSGYISTQGTSFSAPLAAGCAALIWSANPGWTRQQVASHMMNTADNIDAQNPAYVGMLGAGRINLLRALGDEYLRYPTEFPTMYDAMNSSSAGDTIQVQGGSAIPGPLVVIGNKDMVVLAGYDSGFTSRDPVNNKAVVTGDLTDTVLKFVAGAVGNGTVLDGFLLQGGGGLSFSGIPFSGRFGGGAILNGVSPTLRNIEITGCSVGSSSQLGAGGGLMMNNSSAILEDLHIHGNTGIYGGGVYANNSSPTFINCVIEDNSFITDNPSFLPQGGGFYTVDSDLTLQNTTVSGHADLENGGGLYLTQNTGSTSLDMTGGAISSNSAKTAGGGLFMDGGTADLSKVTFSGNTKTATSTFMNGGAFNLATVSVTMDSLVVQGNEANAGGGGVLTSCPTAELTNSLITGNTAQFYGGALSLAGTNALISGNTIAENEGTFSGGGGIYGTGSTPTITNNIIAFNTGAVSFANGVQLSTAPTAISCNDIFGNATSDVGGFADPIGTDGNFSADPLFCGTGDDPFNLQNSSPCLPANSGGCGLIGALTSGCGTSPVLDPESGVPSTFVVQKAFPNPFNPKTTIRFSLPEAAQTSVVVYDVAGRRVRTLIDEVLPAQVHDVSWTGDDDGGRRVAAGVYFYMVKSGENMSVGRMALVK